MKVSDLSGRALDYWTGKALGKTYLVLKDGRLFEVSGTGGLRPSNWRPTINWVQGGPIIEREQLAIIPVMGGTRWSAERDAPTGGDDYEVYATYGDSPLIAGMRCVVAAKFGPDVEDL